MASASRGSALAEIFATIRVLRFLVHSMDLHVADRHAFCYVGGVAFHINSVRLPVPERHFKHLVPAGARLQPRRIEVDLAAKTVKWPKKLAGVQRPKRNFLFCVPKIEFTFPCHIAA